MHGHPGVCIKRSEYEAATPVDLNAPYAISIKPLFELARPKKDIPEHTVVPEIVYG